MRGEKCIFFEETRRATAILGRNQTEKKFNEERPRKEMHMRVGRYHKYTPLKVSPANLYKEVKQVERFPKLKALR